MCIRDRKYTADLVNNLGNLAQRVVALAKSKKVKPKIAVQTDQKAIHFYQNLQFFELSQYLMEKAKILNQQIDHERPWEKPVKSKKLTQFLSKVFSKLWQIADSIEPIMPQKSVQLKEKIEKLKKEPLFERL